jgi:arabinose-5-phosphate isomerase
MTFFISGIRMNQDQNSVINLAKEVLLSEAKAISALIDTIDHSFYDTVQTLLHCQGRVIVTGMGKSGHIANKIAATLASTGTPSFFVHPGEASHGDLGMITGRDVVLALSYSGETQEILSILPMLARFGIPLITITGNTQSTLAKASHLYLNIKVEQEACPLGLAPTSSTTACLALGDALAIACLTCRGFTQEDFSRSHPGGTLGKRLLITVKDLMHTGKAIPTVSHQTSFADTLKMMNDTGFGIAVIIDEQGAMMGVLTDGDIRRAITNKNTEPTLPVTDVMTVGGKSITMDCLAAKALKQMEDSKITNLLVIDEQHAPIGILHLHDILRAGII